MFQGLGCVVCGRELAQARSVDGGAIKVSKIGQALDFISDDALVDRDAIQLPGVKSGGKSSAFRMAGMAFAAAGVMPNLFADLAVLFNEEFFIEAGAGDE